MSGLYNEDALEEFMKEVQQDVENLAMQASNSVSQPAAGKSGFQLKKLKPEHNAIADYIVINPTATHKEIANAFGVTPQWISMLTRTDAFQHLISEKEAAIFSAVVIPLKEKVNAAAHIAIEKTVEVLHDANVKTDKEFIVNTADRLLKSLDYGSGRSVAPGAGIVQNNFYTAPKAAVEQARRFMKGFEQEAEEAEIIDGTKQLTTSKEIQGRG